VWQCRTAGATVPHPAATDGCGWDSLPMDLFFHWIQSSHTLLNLNILAIPSIARPIYFSFELCALRLCGDLGRYLRPGFAKREGDHETAEMISAIVSHYLRSIVHCISQLHDLNPFSDQNHFLRCCSSPHLCSFLYGSLFLHRWNPKTEERGRWLRRINLAVVEGDQL
jgi:hypothetical protein